MLNWFKLFDKKYPYLIIVLLILIGLALLYVRLAGYTNRPTFLGVFILGEAFYLFYKRFLKPKGKNNNKLNDDVAEAMASKIKFEADQHRKDRDSHNYVKISYDEEE